MIFVEDPSVANYIASLPQAIYQRGWSCLVYATGLAVDCLDQRNITFQKVAAHSGADEILDSVRPKIVMVGTASNPDTIGLQLIRAARQKNLPTIGLVDAFMNAEKRFRGRTDNAMAYGPDWVLVPDNTTKHAFIELGFIDDRIVICGHPQYDYVCSLAALWQQEKLLHFRKRILPNAQSGQQIVVFAGEQSEIVSPDVLAHYTIRGRGMAAGRSEIVLEEFLDAIRALSQKPYVVLRIHPKDTASDFAAYGSELDLISQGGSPLELIYAADLVVGMTSMLLTEAVLMGKKTLSIIPIGAERDWEPSVRNGITPCVTTREELHKQLHNLLAEARTVFARSDGRNSFVLGAVPRILALLNQILSSTGALL